MDAANPILGNTLLLLAILLFLAILPRALRQTKKTALDRTVERFEKEELKDASEGESDENDPEHEQTDHPKDKSLAYLMEDLPTSSERQGDGSIPPFPVKEEQEEKDELVKIVKEGVPISHNEAEASSTAPKTKVKLIKQDISIAPDKNKMPSKKVFSEPLKSKIPAQDQNPKEDGDSQRPPVSNHESEESDSNWIEAEIPGLIMDPSPVAERSESIPTFKASPKSKHPSGTGNPKKSSQKEKHSLKVKNITPKSEEIKDSKPKKQVKTKTDSLELKIEISESKPKPVEIKAPIVSHRNIAKKGAGQKKTKKLSAKTKTGKTQKPDSEVTAVPSQREVVTTSPEKTRPKPFFLDLKYLDQEELEKVDPVAQGKLSTDMMDVVIDRLNALQTDLENQLVALPGELAPYESPMNGNMRKDRIEDTLPDLEGEIIELLDKKEVSLEELDSFLFTSSQRKK